MGSASFAPRAASLQQRGACTCRAESPGRRERPDIPNSPLNPCRVWAVSIALLLLFPLSFLFTAGRHRLRYWLGSTRHAPLPSLTADSSSLPAVQPSAVDRHPPFVVSKITVLDRCACLDAREGVCCVTPGRCFSSGMVMTIIADERAARLRQGEESSFQLSRRQRPSWVQSINPSKAE